MMIDEDEIKLAPMGADWLQALVICSTFSRNRTTASQYIQHFIQL